MYCDDYLNGISGEESKKRIAKHFRRAIGTIRRHIEDGYERLGIHARAELPLALDKWKSSESSSEFKVGDVVSYRGSFMQVLGASARRNVIGLELAEWHWSGKQRKRVRHAFATDFSTILPIGHVLGRGDLPDR